MFIPQSKKGSAVLNALILFAIVAAAVAVVFALVKIKPDPKEAGSFKHSLALGKKK